MNSPAKKQPVGLSQGRRLLELARATLEHRLGILAEVDRHGLDDESLQQPCGTFVTLKINDGLRGCIGNLEADGSIVDSVEHNALHAAFHDHRFQPLTAEELERVDIDISILSTPERLKYLDYADLKARLRPLVDGVILRHGGKRATFLPQVWSQLPEADSFLEHLCLKAGLPAAVLQREHLDIFTYQVQSFKENKR
ncbi:MAG: AmmeMemoRadiSam system protein A [Desulfocapsaceae bacterium]|jgi:AmmeMemoRadiSam system protein A|nr:AmmeMemoRadiSam system protein A [Desulfocapsaceae bacterium]